MTVQAQPTAVGYTGNGATLVFAYTFRILDATFVKVYFDDVLQVGGYTVDGVGDQLGGNVTFAVAPPNGVHVRLQRFTAKTQGVDYTPYDAFPAETHEEALDKLTMLVQEGIADAGNALKVPADEAVITTFPDAAARANTFAAFDASGNVIVAVGMASAPVTPFMATVLDDVDAAAARTTLGAVGLTGNENVGGNKTFTGAVVFSGSADLGAVGVATTPANGDDDTSVVTSAFVNNMAGRTVRQTALFGRVDANGYANFLTTGSGLRPGLAATATPLELSISNGMKEQYESFAADVADILGADLPLNNTSFVYRTVGGPWASGLIPPQYGYAFDRTQAALLNFEGTNGATTTTDDFGNTVTLTTATISTAQFKFGASSLDCTSGAKYAKVTGPVSFGDGSWEMSIWMRLNSLPGAATFATVMAATNAAGYGVRVDLRNNAGTTKLRLIISSNGSSGDIVNAVEGANTSWPLNQWHKIRVVFDALAGTYRSYVSLNGAAETQDQTTSSTARVCAFTEIDIGRDLISGINQLDAWIDAFRILRCATKTGTETPSASAPTIANYPVHFFSIPEMKMYEATGASGSAGTNPTMTRRSRLFAGECDTSGAAVTAARTYALRGEFASAWTAVPSSGVKTSFASNIGLLGENIEYSLKAKNLTAAEAYKSGDVTDAHGTYFSGTYYANFSAISGEGRNITIFITSSAAGGGSQFLYAGKSSFQHGGINASVTTWQLQALAKRRW